MKWQPCERREGVFSYEDADGAVAWAKANQMPMRGHALLWATGAHINTYIDCHELTSGIPKADCIFVSRHPDAQLAGKLLRQ